MAAVPSGPSSRRQKALGAVIRARREHLDLSQEALAAEAHLHRNYVGRVERGELNVSLSSIASIAEALDVPMSTLFAEYERELD